MLHLLGADRTPVIARLVGALRPGGWLLVEDEDSAALDASLSDAPDELVRWNQQLAQIGLEKLGADMHAGRRLLDDLHAAGLTDIGSEGRLFIIGRHAASVEFLAAIEQGLPALEAYGLSSQVGVEWLRYIRSPSFHGFGPIQYAGWGRRKEGR